MCLSAPMFNQVSSKAFFWYLESSTSNEASELLSATAPSGTRTRQRQPYQPYCWIQHDGIVIALSTAEWSAPLCVSTALSSTHPEWRSSLPRNTMPRCAKCMPLPSIPLCFTAATFLVTHEKHAHVLFSIPWMMTTYCRWMPWTKMYWVKYWPICNHCRPTIAAAGPYFTRYIFCPLHLTIINCSGPIFYRVYFLSIASNRQQLQKAHTSPRLFTVHCIYWPYTAIIQGVVFWYATLKSSRMRTTKNSEFRSQSASCWDGNLEARVTSKPFGLRVAAKVPICLQNNAYCRSTWDWCTGW